MLGHFDPHLSHVIIDEETAGSINGVLRQLIKDSQATSGCVLDRAGQIIVWDGPAYDGQRMQLGALIAGTYASTREVARMLQEGAREKIFTEAVGEQWLVSLIFGKHTALGLVKVLCNRATMDLQQVLISAMERQGNHPRLRDVELEIVANDTIDLIFRTETE